jgi:hypothetical protein
MSLWQLAGVFTGLILTGLAVLWLEHRACRNSPPAQPEAMRRVQAEAQQRINAERAAREQEG